MGINLFRAEQFIKAIPGSGGIISTIALRVGCSWNTANKYIHEHPTIQKAFEDEKESVSDLAVSILVSAMQKGAGKEADREDLVIAIQSSKWWLERKRKNEFSVRQENLNIDLNDLSDEELERLSNGEDLTHVLKRPGPPG